MKSWPLWALGVLTTAYWYWIAPGLDQWPKVIAGATLMLVFYGVGYARGQLKATAQGEP